MRNMSLGVLAKSFYSAFGDGKNRYLERRRERKIVKKNLKADEKLKNEVLETLKWNPDVDTTDIGVVVHSGIVALYGSVDSVHALRIAEEVTEEIQGVVDVDNHLTLKPTLDLESDKVIVRGDEGLFTREEHPK